MRALNARKKPGLKPQTMKKSPLKKLQGGTKSERQSQVLANRRDLASCMSLCEQRIQELSPPHPLTARVKRGGTNCEYEGVEASLHNLILTNEEQKNYIEILKEALEVRAEELGVGKVLATTIGGNVTQGEALAKWILLSKELESSAAALNEKQTYIEEMESLLVELKEEIEQQKLYLQKLNSEYEEQAKEKNKVIAELNEKVEKLNSEREVLLDYAEDAEEYKRSAEMELRQAKGEDLETAKAGKLLESQAEIKFLEDELVEANKQLQNNQRLNSDEERIQLKLENDRLGYQVESLSKMLRDLAEENGRQKQEIALLQQSKQDTSERDQLLKENTSLTYEVQRLKRTLQALRDASRQAADSASLPAQADSSVLEHRKSVLQLPRASAGREDVLKSGGEEAQETTKNFGESLKLDIMKLKGDNEVLQEQNAEYLNKITKLNNDLHISQNNLKQSQQAYKDLEGNYEKLKADFASAKAVSCP